MSASAISGMAKKILMAGLGAVFMTEEAFRENLKDLKIPKEFIGTLLENAKKQKNELFSYLVVEVKKFLKNIKVNEELQKALDGMTLHVEADISFSKKKNKTTLRSSLIKK